MSSNKQGINTICTHSGAIEDATFKGSVSPLYMSTSFDFMDVETKRYPRYFNTPNQEYLSKKIAALEQLVREVSSPVYLEVEVVCSDQDQETTGSS